MNELLLAVALALPNPVPVEMMVEPEATQVSPYAGYQFTEEELRNLLEPWMPAEHMEWAVRVSWCESRWYTQARNPQSGAAGLFQFKRSTWDWVADQTGTPDYDSGGVWEAHSQAINAAWLVENGGKQHWVCK